MKVYKTNQRSLYEWWRLSNYEHQRRSVLKVSPETAKILDGSVSNLVLRSKEIQLHTSKRKKRHWLRLQSASSEKLPEDMEEWKLLRL